MSSEYPEVLERSSRHAYCFFIPLILNIQFQVADPWSAACLLCYTSDKHMSYFLNKTENKYPASEKHIHSCDKYSLTL